MRESKGQLDVLNFCYYIFIIRIFLRQCSPAGFGVQQVL